MLLGSQLGWETVHSGLLCGVLLLRLLLPARMDPRHSNTLDCHRYWRQRTFIRISASYQETVTWGKLLNIFEYQFLIAISVCCWDGHVR